MPLAKNMVVSNLCHNYYGNKAPEPSQVCAVAMACHVSTVHQSIGRANQALLWARSEVNTHLARGGPHNFTASKSCETRLGRSDQAKNQ